MLGRWHVHVRGDETPCHVLNVEVRVRGVVDGPAVTATLDRFGTYPSAGPTWTERRLPRHWTRGAGIVSESGPAQGETPGDRSS